MGEDYAYPFSNTVSYFTEDEYTIANLECTLSDKSLSSAEQFYFKAPSAYVNILTEGGVDFVSTANNHSMDFYEQGLADTCEALDSAGIPYINENEHKIVETPSGLKLGIYTCFNNFHPEEKFDSLKSAVEEMRASGAELIIVMFHWGQELYYTPNDNQVTLAHRCIDELGVDIVYGSHTHCLQPVEEYNGKLIMYSMGNWVFGGNTAPSDPDTAIVRATIKRDIDGTVSYEGFECIPCCVSNLIDEANAKANNTNYNFYANYNKYCPTPYSEDNEGYARTMSKLQGLFEAASEGADYSSWYASWS